MRFKSFWPISLLCVLWFITRLCSAGEPAAQQLAKMPDWALGTLTFSHLRTGMDKIGLYANRLVPNSSELAKNAAAHALFNELPLGAGIKDGPAVIYALDPIETGLKNEIAFELPAGDPAVVKEDLVNALGVPADKNGAMAFTILGVGTNPDKILFVSIVGNRLFAAPSELVLNKLKDTAPFRPNSSEAEKDSDVRLAIKVASIKRLFQGIVELSLSSGVDMVTQDPKQADALRGRIKQVLETLWQIEFVELHLNVDEKGSLASLELQVKPERGTSLAAQLEKPATPTTGAMLQTLPADAPIAASWNLSGVPLVKWLQSELKNETGARNSSAELMQALLSLLQYANDEGAMTFSGLSKETNLMVALKVSDAAKTESALQGTLEDLGKVDKSLTVKPTSKKDHNGATIEEYEMDIDMMPMRPEKKTVVRSAITGSLLFLSLGNADSRAIESAVDHPKGDAGEFGIPADASAMLKVNPVLLARRNPETSAIAGDLVDAPVTLFFRQTTKLIGLRIDILADAARGTFNLYRRMDRVGAVAPKTEPVPAPPAP